MKNPYVIFNLDRLISNIKYIKNSCIGVKFLFPVKICKNPHLMDVVNELLDGFDVSNKQEYQCISKYKNGNQNKIISSSGPLSFENNIDDSYIAVNSLNRYKTGLGIRVNFNFDTTLKQSHFGHNLIDVPNEITKDVTYIHFHVADDRNDAINLQIYKNIKLILKKFPNLKALNIGGHLESLSHDDAINYINEIRRIVPKNIELFVEVGDLLFFGCGTLYCSVVDCKIKNNKQQAILNVVKLAGLRWSGAKYKEKSTESKLIETEFFGCSCCEDDFIEKSYCHELRINEEIVFENISPYSYEWNNSFNGISKIKYFFK